MLIKLLENINKFKHHKRLIQKLIKNNLLMNDLQISDRGGCIIRDSENKENYRSMNNNIKNMIILK